MDLYQNATDGKYGKYGGEIEKLQDDLFTYHDIKTNPKRFLLFSKAWALGHADGIHDVISIFDDLIDLIK